ncbi:uncharacterized protein [Palaemon carinicauda]|uniref:uncharacterized protein n=1 Tax=Palaemon carinicauda TaxID=392227 RepID=UPI0035B68DDE
MGDTSPVEAWDELTGLLMLPETESNGRWPEISLSHSSVTPHGDDDEINALARRKPPQPTHPNPRPNPAWCFYHQQLMVNTGAMQSTFPPSQIDLDCGSSKNAPSFVAANGPPIRCYGTRILRISILGRSYSWPFAIADVSRPLLGADFLTHHGLLVDITGKHLIETGTCWSRALRAGPATMSVSAVMTQPYADLLQEFPGVFKAKLRQSPGSPSKHRIYHHITTTRPPTHKPDGTWRPCSDYRRPNLITTPNHYRLPNMQDLTNALHGAKYFTKMDLLKSYFQVPVFPEDIPKTAIVTPFGSYTFAYSTFGVRNAWATFKRLMDSILGDLPFCVCYVDDILIFSRTKEENRRHVRAVLKRLQENGLVERFDKCTFGAEGVHFLGHRVSSSGTLTPLDDVLKGKAKQLEWGSPQHHAFTRTKDALANATTLAYFDDKAPLRLTTDATHRPRGTGSPNGAICAQDNCNSTQSSRSNYPLRHQHRPHTSLYSGFLQKKDIRHHPWTFTPLGTHHCSPPV